MNKLIYVFLISMLPIIELRGAIPAGFALGLPAWQCFLASVVGNILPVPFILLFIRAVLKWMTRSNIAFFKKIACWIEEKAKKNAPKITKYATWGLLLFVAIPLPGTGAWTGALVAAMLEMDVKHALLSVFCGVLLAGCIVTAICSGVLGFLSFLL